MKLKYQIGIMLLAIVLLSTVTLAAKPEYAGPGADNNETDYELNETEDDLNETEDDAGPAKNKTKKSNGKQGSNITLNDTTGEQAKNKTKEQAKNKTSSGNQTRAGEIKLTGIERAIQVITRAQERLAARNKTAPGHTVALNRLMQKVLSIGTNLTDDAQNVTALGNKNMGGKLARDAERMANRTGNMNETELEDIVNESQKRNKVKKLKKNLGNVSVDEDELEDELNETVGLQLKAEIKVMSNEFKAMLKGVLENGTVEEKQQLAEQFGELVQVRKNIANKIQKLDKVRIRKMLSADETVEEIASDAV